MSQKFSLFGSLAALVMDSPRASGTQRFVIYMAPSLFSSPQFLTQKLQSLLMTSNNLICKLKRSHLEDILADDFLFSPIFLQLLKTSKFGTL